MSTTAGFVAPTRREHDKRYSPALRQSYQAWRVERIWGLPARITGNVLGSPGAMLPWGAGPRQDWGSWVALPRAAGSANIRSVTAQGHRLSRLQRALRSDNAWLAVDAARELERVPLTDAFGVGGDGVGCQNRRRLPLCSGVPRDPGRPGGGQLIEVDAGGRHDDKSLAIRVVRWPPDLVRRPEDPKDAQDERCAHRGSCFYGAEDRLHSGECTSRSRRPSRTCRSARR